MYFFALSHAPPPDVIAIATKRPVTTVPTSNPPSTTGPNCGIAATATTKISGSNAGTIISRNAALVTMSTHVPYSGGKPPAIGNSLAGTVGHTIEPLIKPLGFNWKIGIGLITSLAARETIVSTLGSIYGMDPATEQAGLQKALRQDLSLGGAIALLIFFAFAMQCISTIAVVRRETGGWTWPALQFTYMAVLAYVGAFVAFHVIG